MGQKQQQKLNNLGLGGFYFFCLKVNGFSLVTFSALLGKVRVGLVYQTLFYSFFTFYLENMKLI